MVPVLVLVSDGRTNSSLNDGDPYEEAIEIANKIAAEKIQSIVYRYRTGFYKVRSCKEYCGGYEWSILQIGRVR